MSRYRREPIVPQAATPERTAVLLINLGTPDAPTAAAVRPYFKEFLSDPRVVEIPKPIWWLILNGIILPFRSPASAKKYAKIWLSADAQSGRPAESPLMRYTQAQADALQAKLPESVTVMMAMRYGNPSITSALEACQKQGFTRILCVPLYPQFSATTTATAYDVVFTELSRTRNQAAVRTIKHYYAHPTYIYALKKQVEHYWAAHGRPNFSAGEKLVFSFHGVPQRVTKLGDPYYFQCMETGNLLGNALGLNEGEYRITFQSRFGKEEWLQPYTAVSLEELGKAACKRVDVFCPGFPADCLETLEEINMEVRQSYEQAGGKNYHYIPCLNEQLEWIDALATITKENLGNWQ